MLSENFFTGFAPNMPANSWSFTYSVPLARITTPSHNENFSVGDTLIVRASLQDVREATLTINERNIQTRTGLSGRNFEFNGYQLTSSDVGNLSIGVSARNGQGVEVNLSTVRVNVRPLTTFTVTFNPNGGSVSSTSRIVPQGSPVGSLPVPTRLNYDFVGWFSVANETGGVEKTDEFVIDRNITFFARWRNTAHGRMMDNLANDTTLPIPSADRRSAMVIMGQVLLDEGYSPAFVAGMLANIMREGSFGQFENSNYASNPSDLPLYLRYFVDNHNYTERFSNRLIYDVDVTPNELYGITSNSPNQTNIFGLGLVQWTHVTRFFPLLNLYIEMSGGGARRITRTEVIKAETRMMILELEEGGTHNSIYQDWKTASSNANSEDDAFNAAHMLCLRYLIPDQAQSKAVQRGNDARAIIRIMTS